MTLFGVWSCILHSFGWSFPTLTLWIPSEFHISLCLLCENLKFHYALWELYQDEWLLGKSVLQPKPLFGFWINAVYFLFFLSSPISSQILDWNTAFENIGRKYYSAIWLGILQNLQKSFILFLLVDNWYVIHEFWEYNKALRNSVMTTFFFKLVSCPKAKDPVSKIPCVPIHS